MGRNFAGLERDTMKKIVQTAGRNALGEFAPQFAHFNDDVLFGENEYSGWFSISCPVIWKSYFRFTFVHTQL